MEIPFRGTSGLYLIGYAYFTEGHPFIMLFRVAGDGDLGRFHSLVGHLEAEFLF